MRGDILRYDDMAGSGLISGEDGVRYTFARSDLQQLTPVMVGAKVDFVAAGETATQVFLVATPAPEPTAAPVYVAPGPDASTIGIPQRGLWGQFVYCLKHYVDGNGRASRAEYWSFTLFAAIFIFVCILIDTVISVTYNANEHTETFLPIFTCLFALAIALPGITVTIRRLHDVGMSGWMYLVGCLPYIGGLFLFVISLLPSQAGPNKHGPGPGQSFA